MLSRIRSASSGRTMSGVSAVCGVTMQRGSENSGWPSGSGSGDVTSRPAPWIAPERSASSRASGSTSAPRAMLTRTAVSFIALSCAAPMSPAVSSVLAAASMTTSAPASTSSSRSAVTVRSAPSTGSPLRRTTVTVQSNGASSRMYSSAMPPAPTTTTSDR